MLWRLPYLRYHMHLMHWNHTSTVKPCKYIMANITRPMLTILIKRLLAPNMKIKVWNNWSRLQVKFLPPFGIMAAAIGITHFFGTFFRQMQVANLLENWAML